MSQLTPWTPQLFAWQAWHLATSALGDIDSHFAWQVWHLWRWAGSYDALGCLLTALCVGGVALGDINPHSAWQAWHLLTSTFTLRGRRGTWHYRLSLCVAGVALTALKLPLILIAAPETCMSSSGGVHRYGRCSRAARLFLSASAVHTHTHAHVYMHT